MTVLPGQRLCGLPAGGNYGLLDAPPDETVRSALGQDALDELPELLYWARIDTFAKAAVNAALATSSRKDDP